MRMATSPAGFVTPVSTLTGHVTTASFCQMASAESQLDDATGGGGNWIRVGNLSERRRKLPHEFQIDVEEMSVKLSWNLNRAGNTLKERFSLKMIFKFNESKKNLKLRQIDLDFISFQQTLRLEAQVASVFTNFFSA